MAVSDQAVIAVGNLLMLIVITRMSGVTSLGRFALVSTTILLCMTVSRILVTDPWLASRTASGTPTPELRWLILISAALTLCVVAIVVSVCSSGNPQWYIACAIGPIFIVQDFGRYVAFRDHAPAVALLSDSSALVAGVVVFIIWATFASADLVSLLSSWLIGITAGALVLARRLFGDVRRRGAGRWWLLFCRPLATKLALDGAGYIIGVSGSLYLLAFLATPHDVGTVRMVQTMFSPAVLTVTGLNMWLVPS